MDDEFHIKYFTGDDPIGYRCPGKREDCVRGCRLILVDISAKRARELRDMPRPSPVRIDPDCDPIF